MRAARERHPTFAHCPAPHTVDAVTCQRVQTEKKNPRAMVGGWLKVPVCSFVDALFLPKEFPPSTNTNHMMRVLYFVYPQGGWWLNMCLVQCLNAFGGRACVCVGGYLFRRRHRQAVLPTKPG